MRKESLHPSPETTKASSPEAEKPFRSVWVFPAFSESADDQINLRVKERRFLASGAFGNVNLVETGTGELLAEKEYRGDYQAAIHTFEMYEALKEAGVPTFDQMYHDANDRLYSTYIGPKDAEKGLQEGEHVLLGVLQGGEARRLTAAAERCGLSNQEALAAKMVEAVDRATKARIFIPFDAVLLDLKQTSDGLLLDRVLVGDLDGVSHAPQIPSEKLREENKRAIVGTVMCFCDEFNVPEEQVRALDMALFMTELGGATKSWDEL